MEIIDLYDNERKLTGEKIVRGSEIPSDRYRIVVHIVVISDDDKMLIQKRIDSKKKWPGKWDVSVGGAVQSGESSNIASERELFEELGLKYDFSKARPTISVAFDRGFDDYFVIKYSETSGEIKLQDTEVSDFKWASENEILDMIDSGDFIPYRKQLINLFFSLYNSNGGFVVDKY